MIALERRGSRHALLWLAQHTEAGGRAAAIKALCRACPTRKIRDWLLRHACDETLFAASYAGRVATAAHLHAAVVDPDADDALIDHTGRLLCAMSDTNPHGWSLPDYPPAPLVVDAYLGHIAAREPTRRRYEDAAVLATYGQQRERIAALLKSPRWNELGGDLPGWFAENVAAELGL